MQGECSSVVGRVELQTDPLVLINLQYLIMLGKILQESHCFANIMQVSKWDGENE